MAWLLDTGMNLRFISQFHAGRPQSFVLWLYLMKWELQHTLFYPEFRCNISAGTVHFHIHALIAQTLQECIIIILVYYLNWRSKSKTMLFISQVDLYDKIDSGYFISRLKLVDGNDLSPKMLYILLLCALISNE